MRRRPPGSTPTDTLLPYTTLFRSPVVALARTDVLKDGASAIYGADAMAGVVNLITRNDYEGLGVSARYGVTDRGDGGDFTADLIWGARGDRGGIMMAATYQKTNAVNMASRAPCSLAEVTPGARTSTRLNSVP